MTKPTQ